MKHNVQITVVMSVIVCVLLAAANAANPTSRAAAAARPAPTPTPVAIAYDEINRMAFAQVTPPPVGAFSADYERITSAAANPQQSVPRGISGMINRAMGVQNAENAMANLQSGTLKRYTFYWVKGWIRVDDPLAHTATIYKCRERQTIYLDLAKKTYRVVNETGTQASSQPSESTDENPYAQQMAQPGTATMTVTAKASALGPKVIEGIQTQGYDSSNSLAMTNATGSCRNGSFSSHVVEYISNINEQRAYCPLPGVASGEGARYGGPPGGCKPNVVAHQTGSVHPPANKLAMYRLAEFGAGQGQGGSMVLERGHVTWLYNPDIPPLFTVPADFTQQS